VVLSKALGDGLPAWIGGRRPRRREGQADLSGATGAPAPPPTPPLSALDAASLWQLFLEHKFGVQSMAKGTSVPALATAGALSGWEMELIRDPLFEKFLKYGPGRTGLGPKTVADFLALPSEQKAFYARVFKSWKQIVRQRGIDLSKLD
jgi:hypothetical protein